MGPPVNVLKNTPGLANLEMSAHGALPWIKQESSDSRRRAARIAGASEKLLQRLQNQSAKGQRRFYPRYGKTTVATLI